MRKSLSDLLAGVGFLIIALAFFVQYGDLSGVSRVFPEALISFIGVGGVYFVLKGLWFMRREKAAKPRPAAPSVTGDASQKDCECAEPNEDALNWTRVALVSGLAIVYLVLIGYLGFFVSSAAFLFAASLILGDRKHTMARRLGISLAYAFLFNLCVWLLFVKLLLVPTPEGLLF